MAHFRQVVCDLVGFARVDEFALREDNELIEERDDVAARLVDGEHDCTVIVTSERDEADDDA